jgi:hypothetical protein
MVSLIVEEVVPLKPPPSQFTGIAFTPAGEIFMTAWNNKIYRLEDDQRLTLMSAMSLAMADLTSCNFPLAVLAAANINFIARVHDEIVKLSWTPLSSEGSFDYIVERSADNRTWTPISRSTEIRYTAREISFSDESPLDGKNFYRVKIVGQSNFKKYSVVRAADINNSNRLEMWPNPVNNDLFILNNAGVSSVAVYDFAGNKVHAARIVNGVNNINLAALPAGKYFISVTQSNNKRKSYKIIKK